MRQQQLNWMRLQNRETMKCIKGEWEGWKAENEERRNSKQAEGGDKEWAVRTTGRQTTPLSYELHLILILTGLFLNIPHYQHSAPSAPLSLHFKNLKKHPGCNIQ